MSKIAMQTRGKRPRFFPGAGTDELVSMLLELSSELWTVKERLYALERAADDAGLDLTRRIEAWQPTDHEAGELDAAAAAGMQVTACRKSSIPFIEGQWALASIWAAST